VRGCGDVRKSRTELQEKPEISNNEAKCEIASRLIRGVFSLHVLLWALSGASLEM